MNLRLLRAVDKWRAQYNPLRGLNTQRAVTLLDEGEGGAYADLMWTFRRLEKREPTLRGLKRLRIAAIGKLDWAIRTKDDSPAAMAQADALRAAYDGVKNLNKAIRFLALAEFRGFAHLEKVYANDDPTQPVVELCPVEQWHWVRDGLYGDWQYNAGARNVLRGAPVDSAHFLIREVEDPINEIALLLFVEKALSKKDWVGFIEVFGIPPIFVTLPQNIPSGQEKEYQALAEAIVADLRGVLPNGADIKTVDAGKGASPFKEHIAYVDEQLVLAGTSGKLTMLSAPTGIGSGASQAHDDVFDALAAAEAAEIAEVLQEGFDRPFLAAKFPGEPVLAWFAFDTEDEESAASVLGNAKLAKEAGFDTDARQLSEKTGFKLTRAATPDSGRALARVRPATLNRKDSPDTPALPGRSAAFLAAVAEQAAPVTDLLENLPDEKADPAAYEKALAEIRERLPELMDPAVLADALGADMLAAAGFARTHNRAEPDEVSPLRRKFGSTLNSAAARKGDVTWNEADHPRADDGKFASKAHARIREAMTLARRRGATVHNAFIHPEHGPVSIAHGHDEHGDRSGMGLEKISRKHPEATDAKVADLLIKGEWKPHRTIPGRMEIFHGGLLGSVAPNRNGKGWMLMSAYDPQLSGKAKK